MTDNIQQQPVYIPYGDQQMEQASFMKAIADNVQNYVNQQTWSNKRKQKFLDAYSDIVSKGITGASNNSGQWAVDLSGNLDLESKSKKDQEIYHEAAYYILQQMKGLPTKQSQEETKKKSLQLYDNSWHQKAFTGYVGNTMFGGRNWDYTKDWDVLDERDKKTGILGTSGRMAKLADMLEGYSNSLEEGKYNFEGTAFKDLSDLKGRIGNAITSLRNGVLDQSVKDSLNAIGLDWRTYLHDGSDETVTLQDGTTMTRREYLEALQKQETNVAAAKAAQEKQAALDQEKANKGVLNLVSGIHAVEARSAAPAYANYLANQYGVGQQGFNNINTAIQGLIERGRISGLSAKEKKQLGNLLYYVRTNNSNYQKSNITDQEWKELSIHKNLGSQNRAGFIRLPWQTSDGRYTFADDKGNLYFLKPTKQQKLGNVPVVRSVAYNQYKQNFLKGATTEGKRKLAGQRKVMDGPLQFEDYARMGALASDIVGTVAATLPGYGTAASAVLGLGSLGANMAADIADESVSAGQVASNAAMNLGLGVVGLVPGLGLASKSGRWLTQAAKWAPRLLAMYAAGDVALSPEIRKSLQKITSNETLTVDDWKNVGYAFSTVAGLARGARGIADNRKFKPAVKGGGTKTENYITTKSGKKVQATKEQVNELNKVGTKQGTEAANKHLNEKILNNPSGNEEVNVEFKTGRIGKYRSDKVKLESKTTPQQATGRTAAYQRALQIENQRRKSGEGIYRFAPRFLPTSYDIFTGAANKSLPQWRLTDKIKELWDPIGEGKIKQATNSSTSSSTPTTSNQIPDQVASRFTNPTRRDAATIRNILERAKNPKGSSKPLKEGSSGNIVINGNNIKFNYARNKSGELELIIDNGGRISTHTIDKSKGSFHAKELVAKTIEEARQQARNQARSNKTKNSQKMQDLVKQIKQLKKQGFLQQGGTIQQDLNTTISNFLKTQK